MTTRERLANFASKCDGECKVAKTADGDVWLFHPDAELSGRSVVGHGRIVTWDYYFTAEAESFPFERFGIAR